MRLIRRPWYQQPQEAVELERAHPLARGLTVALLPATGLLNLASQANGGAAPRVVPRQGGAGALYRGEVSAEAAAISADVSFVAAFTTGVIGGATGTEAIVGVGPSPDNNNTCIGLHAAHVSPAYAGAVYCGTGYSIIGKPTGGALASNTRYVVGAGVAGGAGDVYLDGNLVASVSSGLSARATTGRVALSANSALLDQPIEPASFEYFLLWNRRLDDWEQRISGTAEVWQLFAPRRIFVPVTVGATLPTLSAPTFVPGSLTSTGWRGRVTAT